MNRDGRANLSERLKMPVSNWVGDDTIQGRNGQKQASMMPLGADIHSDMASESESEVQSAGIYFRFRFRCHMAGTVLALKLCLAINMS